MFTKLSKIWVGDPGSGINLSWVPTCVRKARIRSTLINEVFYRPLYVKKKNNIWWYSGTGQAGSRVSRAWCGSTSYSRVSSAGREREVSARPQNLVKLSLFFLTCIQFSVVDPDRVWIRPIRIGINSKHIFFIFSWKFQYADQIYKIMTHLPYFQICVKSWGRISKWNDIVLMPVPIRMPIHHTRTISTFFSWFHRTVPLL